VTIEGVGTHSGTGEEWADEENAMTSAEAQAFKRACSCFGLGRCFYDFGAPWVDLDDKGRLSGVNYSFRSTTTIIPDSCWNFFFSSPC
jgi:hypothetical protein